MTKKNTKTYPIVLFGAGSFGTALAQILAKAGHQVLVWVREKKQAKEINQQHTNSQFYPKLKLSTKIKATTDLSLAAQSGALMAIALPSKAFRSFMKKLSPYLQGDQTLLHATKGIEMGTGKRMSEIIKEESCLLKIGVLSGPNLARELIKGQPAGAIIASHYDEVTRATKEIFIKTNLGLFATHDVIGTEIGGSFKNILAILSGMAGGFNYGDNTRALIVTRGLSEMAQYGVSQGAELLSFGGLAGIGDLMATCFSPLSRNFQLGFQLAKGKTLKNLLAHAKEVAEGVPTTMAVYQHAKSLNLKLDLTCAVYAILQGKLSPKEALESLKKIQRPSEMIRLDVGE